MTKIRTLPGMLKRRNIHSPVGTFRKEPLKLCAAMVEVGMEITGKRMMPRSKADAVVQVYGYLRGSRAGKLVNRISALWAEFHQIAAGIPPTIVAPRLLEGMESRLRLTLR